MLYTRGVAWLIAFVVLSDQPFKHQKKGSSFAYASAAAEVMST